jgi:imidazoleglycerol-phosphate dehydratase
MSVTTHEQQVQPDALSSNRCEMIDLSKSPGPIATGIGFFNHMIDQLVSHAQIGICVQVKNLATTNNHDNYNVNYHADGVDQNELLSMIGAMIGKELSKLLAHIRRTNELVSSRFSCPLDEALVSCCLILLCKGTADTATTTAKGSLTAYKVPPYGTYPHAGRSHIGKLETAALGCFWKSLAEHSSLRIAFYRNRGRNAHHIVESSFKAFSRALRNLIDAASDAAWTPVYQPVPPLYRPDSVNARASIALQRQASVSRKTKETSIDATILLDGGVQGSLIQTGIETLDTFFQLFADHAGMSMQLTCHGDTWIDEHHSAEDVSIAVGQCLVQALGDKAGLNRMWSDDNKIEAVMDFSNRPYFSHNLKLAEIDNGMIGDLSAEMFEHVLESLVVNARMTVHIVDHVEVESGMEIVRATALAMGESFKYCSMVDLRRAGTTASSKGTLSV